MSEASSTLIEEIIDVQTASNTMAVIRKRPTGGHWPGVVMFHDGPGIRDATHVFARELAGLGYDVVIPDLYHRHGRMIGYEPPEREADPTLVDELWKLLDSLDDRQIQDDLDDAMAATGFDQHQHLGTIGFCVGARAVYRTMMRQPDCFVAGAMWHPSYLCDDRPDSPHTTANDLGGSLFIGMGADDQQQPVSAHQPFLNAPADHELVTAKIYPGADHGYTWRGWPSYNDAAATSSLAETNKLFTRHLPQTK